MAPIHVHQLADTPNYQFRYYSRRVLETPHNLSYHKKRIETAKRLTLNEPLQGALADMLYGCWYDMPYHGQKILSEVKSRLIPAIYQAFESHIIEQKYMMYYSELATRWSVLVMPSLNVASHRFRVSSDDSRQVATKVVEDLIYAKASGDTMTIRNIENDFFEHCIACVDRIGFSLVWFHLAKENWHFDTRWIDCQQYFEIIDV